MRLALVVMRKCKKIKRQVFSLFVNYIDFIYLTTIMRKITVIVLLTFTTLIYGQDSLKLCFPKGVFNCDTIEDKKENLGWSYVLNDFNLHSLYLTEYKTIEIYRLIHWGTNLTIIEFTKQPNELILNFGSTDLTTTGKKKIDFKTLKLLNTTQQNKFTTLFKQVELKENIRKCVDENISIIDDRDSWIFEIRINDQYKFLKVKELDSDLKVLTDFMTNDLNIKI